LRATCANGVESRCVEPTIAWQGGERFTNRLIVKEEKYFVLPDEAADTAAELVELIGVLCHGKARAVESLVCVEARFMVRKEEAAMEVVRAPLGNNLNLRPAKAAVLGIIAIRNDFYAINGIFRRCDNRCPAPDYAGGAYAINRNAVVLTLLPTGNDLRTIFGFEDAVRTT